MNQERQGRGVLEEDMETEIERETIHAGEAIRLRVAEETLLKAKSHGPVTFTKTVLLCGSQRDKNPLQCENQLAYPYSFLSMEIT